MIKEEKPIFLKVFLVVVIILFINIGVFSFKLTSNKGLTGLSIGERITSAYSRISLTSKIFLSLQWIILAVLLLGVFIKDKGLKKKDKEEELRGINLKEMSEGNGTDLDTLYNVLKKKKRLRVSNIAKLFNVKKEVAMGWCKTLEAGNLGVIEYISSKDPIIKIVE